MLLFNTLLTCEKVRGKKNVVFSKDLTGPFGIFVGVSTLKEYGVDKIFVLENDNTDSTQRNVIYVINGEEASLVQAVAGTWTSEIPQIPVYHCKTCSLSSDIIIHS